MSLADQVVVMDEGRIRGTGAVAVVYDLASRLVRSAFDPQSQHELHHWGNPRAIALSRLDWSGRLPKQCDRRRQPLWLRPEFVAIG